ncbi:MAG: hypothetical protein IJ176_07205 [Prevotella sp.]|nr:hypothetical protein [Prevotella sp.]
MKKLFFTLAATAICAMASAQTASIADIDIMPGQTASFTIVVNVGDNEFSGIEFTKMQLPEGITMVENGVIPNSDWDKTAYCDFGIDTDGTIIGAFNSQKDIAIPQNQDFALGTMEIKAAADLEIGTSLTITIPAGKLKFVPGSIPVENEISFKVNVTNTVTLDENSTILPVATTGVNVAVKRTINANEWSTICLPFAMNAEQMAKAFGEGVQLAEFTGWSSEKDNDAIVGITVNFALATEMEANYPYIIKVGSPISEFTVEGVDIEPEEEPYIRVGNKSAERGWFYGTNAVTTVPEENVFLSENKFWYSTGATKIKAFRGYFKFYDVLDAYFDAEAGARIKMSFDDETTGISGVNINVDGEYYNLNGLRVETPAKGIFIKDGKKVVVK